MLGKELSRIFTVQHIQVTGAGIKCQCGFCHLWLYKQNYVTNGCFLLLKIVQLLLLLFLLTTGARGMCVGGGGGCPVIFAGISPSKIYTVLKCHSMTCKQMF